MKYPKGTKKNLNKNIYYGNRGMNLEQDINITNEYYLINDIAVIHKKPTPITVNKVDYPSRLEAVITEAHYKTPSTTDYNGVYKGFYVDFEAKETKNKSSFPLSNIHSHQIKHIESVIKHGGISFVIVSFTAINRLYLLDGNDLVSFINNNERKSIPLSYFEEKSILLEYKFQPRIDYLKAVDKLIEVKYEKFN